jgi:hypothetical protein
MEMDRKYVVFDSYTGDMFFHESETLAQKDFDEAVSIIEDVEEHGYHVYIFEVKKKVSVY